MTTRRNLVKTMFMNILTAGIFATALTACSDDLVNEAEAIDGSVTEVFELMRLEQYSYSVPVRVDIEGDWEIDFRYDDPSNRFCYASPQKGHGHATVKLCMLDNWTDKHNEGEMIIRDLSNGKDTQTFRLMQKCNLDNPDYINGMTRGGDGAASTILCTQGNRGKAVGYGYNCFKEPSLNAISKNPIVALVKLEDNEEFDAGARTIPCADYVQQEFSGSSFEELYRDLNVQTNSKVNKGGLAAELKTSFTDIQKSSTEHMFVYTTVDVKLANVYLEGVDGNTVKDFLTDNAKAAINGEGKYTSDDKGFHDLIEDYGTHLIISGNLGGRLRYASTVEKSLTENTKEATAYAKMSFKNKVVDASSDLDAKLSQKYGSNSSKVYTKANGWGGNGKAGTSENSVDEWIKSLTIDNSIVVGLGENESDLVPLYDLVDTSTDAGKERQARMKDYFETGMAAVMAYDGTSQHVSSDTYKITITDELMKANGYFTPQDGSLVYNVIGNNKVVAMICQEYIPQISNMGSVLTVYPVNNNKPDFSNGRFLGNALYPASRISWNSDGCKITKDADNRNPERVIYMRGGTIFTKEPLGCEIVETQIKAKHLEAAKANCDFKTQAGDGKYHYDGNNLDHYSKDDSHIQKIKYNNEYQYSLVKIGNHIWTREIYTGNVNLGDSYKDRYGTYFFWGRVYWPLKAVQRSSFPAGWHAAKSTDLDDLKKTVSSDGYEKYGERLQKGGASGFRMEWYGWVTFKIYKQFSEKYYVGATFTANGEHHMNYMASDGYNYYIKDNEMGRGKKHEGEEWGMVIRLVMND